MSQIRLENLGYAFTDEPLFSGITLTIGDNHRVGVVGNNGAGKSTLMRCITGELEPTQGRIIKPNGLKFGVIEQEIPANLQDKTLYDVIASVIAPEERNYQSWKVDIALDTFKAPEEIRSLPIRNLSGGWRRLALIARTWMTDPDALLLDEPTNHLDLEKIILLEQWLDEQVQNVPILCISHDRKFLDNCTNTTLFVRATKSAVYAYPFSRAKELLAEDDRAAATRREKELREIKRLEKSAHELRQIGVNNYSDEALKKSVLIARRAEKARAQVTEIHIEDRRDIKLTNSGTHAKRLVEFKNLKVETPDNRLLFAIESLDVVQDERLVILGVNGSGKSRFVERLHAAFADFDSAKQNGITITPSARLGYVDQHLSGLPLDKSMHDFIAEQFSLPSQRVTSRLVEAGFPFETQGKKIGVLSHGERSRLYLLALRLTEPNFYIMDEPTNHLDISGQEQLEYEILRHEAACVLVSHDRSFVSNLGTRFMVIHNHKLVEIESPDIFYRHMTDGTPMFPAEAGKSKDTKPRPINNA